MFICAEIVIFYFCKDNAYVAQWLLRMAAARLFPGSIPGVRFYTQWHNRAMSVLSEL